jgi:hypothetical protein
MSWKICVQQDEVQTAIAVTIIYEMEFEVYRYVCKYLEWRLW